MRRSASRSARSFIRISDQLFRLDNHPCATTAQVSRSADDLRLLRPPTGGTKRHALRAFIRINASGLALTGGVSVSDALDASQRALIRRRAPNVFIRINSQVGANGFPAAPKTGAFIRINASGLALTGGVSVSDTLDASQRALTRRRAPNVFIRINAAGIALRFSENRRALRRLRALLQSWLQPNSASEQITKPHHSMGFLAFSATENRGAAM